MKKPSDEIARKLIADCALALIGDAWREESDVATLVARMRGTAALAEIAINEKGASHEKDGQKNRQQPGARGSDPRRPAEPKLRWVWPASERRKAA